MINDYNLLKNFEALFEMKSFIIWGAGKKGKELGTKLYEYTKRIEFVDKDETKHGEYCGILVHSPEEIINYEKEYAIVLSTDNLKIQESILKQIELMGIPSVDIYTWYAMQTVLVFMENKNGSRLCVKENGANLERLIGNLEYRQSMQEQLLVAWMADNSVFVYQSKKVGSSSVGYSARLAGVYAVHLHDFGFLKLEYYFLRDMIRKISGKIISIVREPIARQLSLLWHYWGTAESNFLIGNRFRSLDEIEKQFYSVPNEEDEFEWYLKEFKDIFDINIYEYPFDKEKGYSIIEKDGISLLLLKTERLNELESVIGKFLGVEQFELRGINIGKYKDCKYAYEDYLRNVKIPREFFEYYYCNNQYMDYFYTKEEKDVFYQRWADHIVDKKY